MVVLSVDEPRPYGEYKQPDLDDEFNPIHSRIDGKMYTVQVAYCETSIRADAELHRHLDGLILMGSESDRGPRERVFIRRADILRLLNIDFSETKASEHDR